MRYRFVIFVSTLVSVLVFLGQWDLQAAPQRFETAPDVSGVKLKLPYSLSAANQTVTVVARLAGDPITVAQSKQGRPLTAAEKQEIRNGLRGQQAAVRPRIEALGATVLFQFQNSLNGIKVTIPRNRLADLGQIPGVVEVIPVAIHELDHQNSIPLIG